MKAPDPFRVITISGSSGSDGSLLVPTTSKDLGAIPETASAAVTVATCTSLWLGGHSVQPGAGMPEITGELLSILIVVDTELATPAPFLAEHVKVTPAVSAVRVVWPQPAVDTIPDSGSVIFHTTVTLLRYHPLLPKVPE